MSVSCIENSDTNREFGRNNDHMREEFSYHMHVITGQYNLGIFYVDPAIFWLLLLWYRMGGLRASHVSTVIRLHEADASMLDSVLDNSQNEWGYITSFLQDI